MGSGLKESIAILKKLNEKHDLKISDKSIKYICEELLLTPWKAKFIEYSFSKYKHPSITKF